MSKTTNKKQPVTDQRRKLWFSTRTLIFSLVAVAGLAGFLLVHTAPASAACTPGSFGTDTMTTTVPNTASYNVWVQVQVPDTTNNSILLDVNGTCYTVTTSSVNTWTWVKASQTTPISLSAGTSYTLELFGTKPGVKVSNIQLLADANCVPTGTTGSNCTTGQNDTTKPIVAMTSPANNATMSGTTTISTTATDDTAMGTVQFQLDGVNIGNPITSTSSTYSYSWNTAATTNGTHTLTAIASDKVGNTSTSSPVSITVSNSVASTTVQNFAWNATAKSLSWTAYPGADAYKIATVQDPLATRTPTTYAIATGTSYTPSALSATTVNYGIRPEQKNADGTYSDMTGATWVPLAKEVTVTWPPIGDPTAPSVSLTAPVTGATVSGTASLTATASDNVGVTKVEFYVSGTLLATTSTSPYATNWNTSAVKNGSYTIQAKAYDAAGNIGSSSTASVTVNNADATAPSTPAGLTAKAISSSQVDLAWSASTDNVGVAKYQVERNGAVVSSVTGTTYSDTSVSASSTYSYNVIAVDAAGNASSASTAATATTPASPDTTKPPAPAGLTAVAASSNQINLGWQASSDPSGIKGYNIYRNGSKITGTPVQSLSYGDTAVSPATTYTYTVTAVDGANNESVVSGSAAATTPASAGNVTIGKTTVGQFKGALVDNRKRVNGYSISQAATFSKVYVYLQPTSTRGQQVLKGLIYSNGGTRLAVSYERTFHSTDAAGWYPMVLTQPVTLQPGKYWIGFISGGSSSVAGFRYSSVTNSRAYNANYYPSGPSNPFGSSYILDPDQMSVYASNN